jgi:hypothetical protein
MFNIINITVKHHHLERIDESKFAKLFCLYTLKDGRRNSSYKRWINSNLNLGVGTVIIISFSATLHSNIDGRGIRQLSVVSSGHLHSCHLCANAGTLSSPYRFESV